MKANPSAGRQRIKPELSPAQVINQLNIRYRVCTKYVPGESNTEDNSVCQCNRPKSDHPENTRRGATEAATKWSMQNNTTEKTDAQHGQVVNGGRYARLDLNTLVETTERLLLEAWRIPEPGFIVSIIGGAKYFKLSERLETNFINSIIDLAVNTDAWLITSGYRVGVPQLVGEAIHQVKMMNLRRKKITAIGVCKWGSVRDKHTRLRSEQESDKVTVEATRSTTGTKSKERLKGEQDLEMNHSHYLMLDDGTVRNYETKDYRTRLVAHVAKMHSKDNFIPAVTVAVEGGKDTIANMYYDLKANIPVVIVNGSGRAADFFHRWLLNTSEMDNDGTHRAKVYDIGELELLANESDSDSEESESTRGRAQAIRLSNKQKLTNLFKLYQDRIKRDLESTLFDQKRPDGSRSGGTTVSNGNGKKDTKGKNMDELIMQVMYCLQPAVRSNIHVFHLNSDTNLPETILRGVCQSRQALLKRRRVKQPSNKVQTEPDNDEARREIREKEEQTERSRLLEVAMTWNCVKAAKEWILQGSLDHILDRHQAFVSALQKNLPAFVYELLNLGLDPAETFSEKNLPALRHELLNLGLDPAETLSEKKDFSTSPTRYQKFLTDLYSYKAVNSHNGQLKYFVDAIKGENEKRIDSVEKLNSALAALVGDRMHRLYFNSEEEEAQYRKSWGLPEIPGNKGSLDKAAGQQRSAVKEKRELACKQRAHDYIMRDLFLWAVLMNYVDMAKVLLSHMKYRICAALLATKILKKYHQNAVYGELKTGLEKSAQYFEQYAINSLDKCDDCDRGRACEVVLQQNELYGFVSCLQVAADADDKLFIAVPCCVQAINSAWYDKLHPNQTRIRDKLALFTGIVTCGLAAPLCVDYLEDDKKPKKVAQSEHRLQSNGLDHSDPSKLEYSRPSVPPSLYTLYWPRLTKFHQSPSVKYSYHLIFYCFFLLLFSYYLLFDFSPPTSAIPSIHWTEILTIIFVTFMLIEEIHLFLRQDSLSWMGKVEDYFSRFFKQMTVLGFLLFYIGLIVRFVTGSSEYTFVAARVILALDVEIWWLRSLSFIIVVPFLGPHLVAIGKMLKDLMFFICIIAIVMIGYGVASRSMVYYPAVNGFTTATEGGTIDTRFDGRSVFRQIIYPVYYLLYGEFGNERVNLDNNPDAGWSIATQVLLAAHMMFVNILLTNLLIAMFSKRFDQVYKDTRNIWYSQQYTCTREYFVRSPFLPPISLGFDIWYWGRMFVFFIKRKLRSESAESDVKVFRMIAKDESLVKEWCELEEITTHEYAHDEAKITISEVVESLEQKDFSYQDETKEMIDSDSHVDDASRDLKQVQSGLTELDLLINVIRNKIKRDREHDMVQ